MRQQKHKYFDIRWKWLHDKGFNVQADPQQLSFMKSLWAPLDEVQAVFCDSRAGTGKSTLSILAGVYEVEIGNYDKIIYLRNAVPVREMGFLPGSVNEKEAPYMQPLIDAMDNVQPGLYEKWAGLKPGNSVRKEEPKIFAFTSAYTRGTTFKKAWVVIDEAQNFELEELQTVYTRCSDCCKIITLGSVRQNDNKKQKRFEGLTPFEVYITHFQDSEKVAFHELATNYRGWFSNHADDVINTVSKLKGAI